MGSVLNWLSIDRKGNLLNSLNEIILPSLSKDGLSFVRFDKSFNFSMVCVPHADWVMADGDHIDFLWRLDKNDNTVAHVYVKVCFSEVRAIYYHQKVLVETTNFQMRRLSKSDASEIMFKEFFKQFLIANNIKNEEELTDRLKGGVIRGFKISNDGNNALLYHDQKYLPSVTERIGNVEINSNQFAGYNSWTISWRVFPSFNSVLYFLDLGKKLHTTEKRLDETVQLAEFFSNQPSQYHVYSLYKENILNFLKSPSKGNEETQKADETTSKTSFDAKVKEILLKEIANVVSQTTIDKDRLGILIELGRNL